MPVHWSGDLGEHVKIIGGPCAGSRGTIQKCVEYKKSYLVQIGPTVAVWCSYADIEPESDYSDWGGWCR